MASTSTASSVHQSNALSRATFQRKSLGLTRKLSGVQVSRRNARGVSIVTRAEVSIPETGIKRTQDLEETYAVADSGKWGCNSCGYVYDQDKGDPNYPVSPGMEFKQLPEDWICPTCGAAPSTFKSMGRELAGFAQNQNYGLGTNSMTSGQKNTLIWGSLAFFFLAFMSGYFLD